MIAPTFNADMASALALNQQLKLLSLNVVTRKKVLRQCAFEVRKASRKNIREQKDYLGQRFAARKKGRKKMLTGLGRKMSAFATSDKGVVTWRNPVLGRIAKSQQEGINQTFDASKRTKQQGKKTANDNATIDQARSLKKEGYRRPSNGRLVVVTIKWIRENLTVAQAGYILRTMRGAGKTTWELPLPARAFLGIDNNELNQIITRIFDNITTNARAK